MNGTRDGVENNKEGATDQEAELSAIDVCYTSGKQQSATICQGICRHNPLSLELRETQVSSHSGDVERYGL